MQRRPSEAPGDTPGRLTRRALRQVARETLRVQRSLPHSLDRGLRGDRGPLQQLYTPAFPGLIPATVTTAITACGTQSTPVVGSGAAQLWYWDDDNLVVAQAANGDDGAAGGPETGIVTINNWYTDSGTIAVGTHIFVAAFSGSYWLIGSDC
jgi:hypothetical protein